CFLFFPYWFTTRSWFGVDFSKTGQIGDTIGGILGPFIAIAAAILTFLAFWVQFKANEQQKKDLQIERFENKFYNLMEIHRNNVHEVIIGETTKGRRAFISMFKELKFTYLIITEYYNEDYIKRHPDHLISDEGIYNISYPCRTITLMPPTCSFVVIKLYDRIYLAICFVPWITVNKFFRSLPSLS